MTEMVSVFVWQLYSDSNINSIYTDILTDQVELLWRLLLWRQLFVNRPCELSVESICDFDTYFANWCAAVHTFPIGSMFAHAKRKSKVELISFAAISKLSHMQAMAILLIIFGIFTFVPKIPVVY